MRLGNSPLGSGNCGDLGDVAAYDWLIAFVVSPKMERNGGTTETAVETPTL